MKVLLLTLFLLSIAFGKELSPEERQDRSIEDQQDGPDDGSNNEPEGDCLELDIAMPHNDLDNGRGRIDDVTSWRQCDAYCMEENDCKFWTYQVKNGKCFLKTSDAGRKKDKKGAISGSSGCSTETVHRMAADGSCFRLSETLGDFDDAQEMCNGVNGKMFEPKSTEVNDEVATATANIRKNPWYWLGITKEESDGTWTYKNGEPISFTNWYANTLQNEKNCAIAENDWPEIHGTWLNVPCIEPFHYALCEF